MSAVDIAWVSRGRGGHWMARIGDVLVSLGECSGEAVQEALRQQRLFGARIGTNLLRIGAVREAQLGRALGILHGSRSLSGDIHVDSRAAALISRSVAERYDVIPYAAVEREVALLVRDPWNLRALDDVAFAIGKKVRPVVVPEARLWALMRKVYASERGPRDVGEVAVAAFETGTAGVQTAGRSAPASCITAAR